MLLEVYRYALKNRDTKFKRIMDSNYDRILSEAISRWNAYIPRPKQCNTAGVDSSWNKRAFQGLSLYAVDALAATSTAQVLSVEYEIDIADSARNEFLESKAMTMEASVANKAIESAAVDLVLVDGSIIPRLRGKSLASAGELVKRLRSEKTVLISKSSESRSQFGSMGSRAGDIYYYGHASGGRAGYSLPKKVYSESGAVVTELYARLRNNTPVVRIELLSNAQEDQVIELLDRISYRSVSGYPYCLKCAHDTCKISDDDIDRLASVYNLRHEPRSRGVLSE